MQLWELEARLGIEDTIARYVRHADSGRSRDLAELFAEDGMLATGDHELVGRAAITTFLEDARSELAGSTVGGGRIRHHVSSVRIDLDDPETATATSYFLAITGAGVDHWGTYRDRFVRRGDRWLFASRRATVEGRAPNSWAASR